jgi:FkbM family methyltransferase
MDSMLIFDIGCHNGQDSDFYLKKGFRVVAVEANPELCKEIKNRFAREIGDGRFTLVERAIAEHDGEISFFINAKHSIWGTISGEWATQHAESRSDVTEITVPAITFPALIAEYGIPHYLKIDIEGADLLCVDALAAIAEPPKYVSIEFEESITGFQDAVQRLRKAGYRKFQIVDQARVPSQEPPRPAREGGVASHRFILGATGLFGKELPAPWVGQIGAVGSFLGIYLSNKLYGLSKTMPWLRPLTPREPSWHDIHASY